jgi:hypothetical protein
MSTVHILDKVLNEMNGSNNHSNRVTLSYHWHGDGDNEYVVIDLEGNIIVYTSTIILIPLKRSL